MWRITCAVLVVVAAATVADKATPRSGEELVNTVLGRCGDMRCVKENVLDYLDNVLGIQSDARSTKIN